MYNTDSFDYLSPSVPIGYYSWQIYRAASSVGTGMIYVSFCWSANTGGLYVGVLGKKDCIIGFSSNPQHVLFVLRELFVRCEVSGHTFQNSTQRPSLVPI